MNLPPGISVSRQQVENVLHESESDDDIIVDEGSSSKIQKKDEMIEYVDDYGRTITCWRSELEARQGFGMDQSIDEDWNNYDDDDTADYEEASSPLEIIGEMEEDYEEERLEVPGHFDEDGNGTFVSMVNHQIKRTRTLFPSMVTHQPVHERVLPMLNHQVSSAQHFVSMVTHQVSFKGETKSEEQKQQDSESSKMDQVSSPDAAVVDLIEDTDDSDEEVEDEDEDEAMETSQDFDEGQPQPFTPIISSEETVGEKKSCRSPDTTTHSEDDGVDTTTHTEDDVVDSSSKQAPAGIEAEQSVLETDSDVEMSLEDTSAKITDQGQDGVVSENDKSHPSNDDDDKNALNDASGEDDDMETDTNIEDSDEKGEVVLEGEIIGQVDGCIDLDDEEQNEKPSAVEDTEEQSDPTVPRVDDAEQVSPKMDGEPEDLQEPAEEALEVDNSLDVSPQIDDKPLDEAQEQTEEIDPKVQDLITKQDSSNINDEQLEEAKEPSEQTASNVVDFKDSLDGNLSSTNNDVTSNDAKQETDSNDMVDNVEASTEKVVGSIPELYQEMYFDGDVEDDEVEDEAISSDTDVLEDETLDTPKINEFTSDPFFKPPEEVNEASKILEFEEENYHPLHQQQQQLGQPSHLQSLLHRETSSRQALSTFGSLPGLSVSSSRYIPPFDHSQQTAFNQLQLQHTHQKVYSTPPTHQKVSSIPPAPVTPLTDSEDEDDDEPGDVFIKGNRLYQRRGKKQGRVGKYLCRDERGIVTVRSQLPETFNKAQTAKEVKNNFTEKLLLETLSYPSEVKTSDLANHEDDIDTPQVIDSSYEDEDEEVFEEEEDENDEFFPDPAYASEDSMSKVSKIKELDEDCVDSEALDEDCVDSEAQVSDEESVKTQTIMEVLEE